MTNKSYVYIRGKKIVEYPDIPYLYLIAFKPSDYKNGIFKTTIGQAKQNYHALGISLDRIEEKLAKNTGIHKSVWEKCRKKSIYDDDAWYDSPENDKLVENDELDENYMDIGASIHVMLEGGYNWEALNAYDILKKIETEKENAIIKLDIHEIKSMFPRKEWYKDISELFEEKKKEQFEDNEDINIFDDLKQPDIFICHDSKDKEKFVRPLADKFLKEDVNVWYDEFSLEIGDSLIEGIEKGLQECRYGVIVLSKNLITNHAWPKKEFRSLITKELRSGRKIILPIWRIGITKKDVEKYSLDLADRVAGKEHDGIDKIVKSIKKKITKK